MEASCVCGHPQTAHTHYRTGTECTHCGPRTCPRYRPQTWWRRLLGSR
jgi:hypothetical protein